MIEKDKMNKLAEPIPAWALKEHPTRKNMTVIHPMAVIDRLNEVFGIGQWKWETTFIDCTKETQTTKTGTRTVYMSSVHGRLTVPEYNILIEQFGGSTNDDKGDALKGGSTDALTKCASYLGIGASIYKGQGNVGGVELSLDDAFTILREASTLEELKSAYENLPTKLKADVEVIALKDELKNKLA